MHLTSLYLSRPSRTCDILSESLKLWKNWFEEVFFFLNIFHTIKLIFYFGTWKGRKCIKKFHWRHTVAPLFAVFCVCFLFLWINYQGRPHRPFHFLTHLDHSVWGGDIGEETPFDRLPLSVIEHIDPSYCPMRSDRKNSEVHFYWMSAWSLNIKNLWKNSLMNWVLHIQIVILFSMIAKSLYIFIQEKYMLTFFAKTIH